MSHFILLAPLPVFRRGVIGSRTGVSRRREATMKATLKSQTFRVVLFLGALASSSLVLVAGQRWAQ